jgi:hypothetical protein
MPHLIAGEAFVCWCFKDSEITSEMQELQICKINLRRLIFYKYQLEQVHAPVLFSAGAFYLQQLFERR